MSKCDYNWLGYGLTLTCDGQEVFLQGEEGCELHDQLEEIMDDGILDNVISEYFN